MVDHWQQEKGTRAGTTTETAMAAETKELLKRIRTDGGGWNKPCVPASVQC
jgi:hypothetical protein